MNLESDRAGVSAPPPLIFGGALALGLAAGRVLHFGEEGDAIAKNVGAAAIAAGILLIGATAATFKRKGTNVNPYAPSTTLVATGVFTRSRNPMYVGMTSIYIGIALRARSIPALVMLPIALALLDSGVVDREERYLERQFGDAYRMYRATVPRWF